MKAETKITIDDGTEFTVITENMANPEVLRDDHTVPTSDITEVLSEHVFQIGEKYHEILEDEEFEGA